jgi:hypothetical protein
MPRPATPTTPPATARSATRRRRSPISRTPTMPSRSGSPRIRPRNMPPRPGSRAASRTPVGPVFEAPAGAGDPLGAAPCTPTTPIIRARTETASHPSPGESPTTRTARRTTGCTRPSPAVASGVEGPGQDLALHRRLAADADRGLHGLFVSGRRHAHRGHRRQRVRRQHVRRAGRIPVDEPRPNLAALQGGAERRDGLQGAAVDPVHPRVIYAATGAGLFRSGNDGRSFRNVDLPTGSCQGNTFRKPNCFFANVVTDVAVQSPDHFGHKGGIVLAAVGWRDGQRPNFNGVPESPHNGLYRSARGKVGTFRRLNLDGSGFANEQHVGRVELGPAIGPQQNYGTSTPRCRTRCCSTRARSRAWTCRMATSRGSRRRPPRPT